MLLPKRWGKERSEAPDARGPIARLLGRPPYGEGSGPLNGVSRLERTESLAGAFTAHRETDFGRQRGPQSASGRSSFPAETANGPLHPPQTAENRGYSAETGNSGLAQDCVVGLAGLEPATRSL